MDHYVVLGVARDADVAQIRSAFRTLARRYHPDAGRGSSVDKFRAITLAYETLMDRERRQRYDRTIQARRIRLPPIVEPLSPTAMRPAVEPLRARRPGVINDDPFGTLEDVFFDVFRIVFPNRRY